MDDKYGKNECISSNAVVDSSGPKLYEKERDNLGQKPLEHFFKSNIPGKSNMHKDPIDTYLEVESKAILRNPSMVYCCPGVKNDCNASSTVDIIGCLESKMALNGNSGFGKIVHQIPLSVDSTASFLYSAPSTLEDKAAAEKLKAIDSRNSVVEMPHTNFDECLKTAEQQISVSSRPLSPCTKARIERNKQLALEKKAANAKTTSCLQNAADSIGPRGGSGFTFTSAGGSTLDISAEAISLASHQVFGDSSNMLPTLAMDAAKVVAKLRRSID